MARSRGGRFQLVRTDEKQPWRVRIVANGRKIVYSEAYASKANARKAILVVVKTCNPEARVWDTYFDDNGNVCTHGQIGRAMAYVDEVDERNTKEKP